MTEFFLLAHSISFASFCNIAQTGGGGQGQGGLWCNGVVRAMVL